MNGPPTFRAIAFYLPQFHPIPENDAWWGRGFTEWTNVAKARPLFPRHHQPNLPGELGFYDLRLAETREAQASLARGAGIEGFCYWHYWFCGRRILEKPFESVLQTRRPDFPFCLAWANESWQGIWHGCDRRTLIAQTYGGRADIDAHFHALLPAFRDPRYIRVDGHPLFVVYQPSQLPDAREFVDRWQQLAVINGLPPIHFVAHLQHASMSFDWAAAGFEAAIPPSAMKVFYRRAWHVVSEHRRRSGNTAAVAAALRLSAFRIGQRLFHWPGAVYRYDDAVMFMAPPGAAAPGVYPVAVPNWDNSPRAGRRAVVLHGSTPELYREHLRAVVASVANRPTEHRLVFIKSWNEWAEGNYLEPDRRFGRAYLDATREELCRPLPTSVSSTATAGPVADTEAATAAVH